ncbi:MAG: rhodanese-like domain-containing protein [Burkholderiaceae bacterium]
MKNLKRNILAIALGLAVSSVFAQQAAPATGTAAPAAKVWTYKIKELTRAQLDEWLGKPEQVLFLDLRRPDELIKFGSFPVFLNIQNKDLEKYLAYIPKDRAIITVSNHAMRAGAAGDLLVSKGYKVIGAAGSEDYENEGGKAVTKITAPPPRVASAAAPAPEPAPKKDW